MLVSRVFFFNDTATTEIYTLSLHDALPIWGGHQLLPRLFGFAVGLLRLVLLLLADERGAELADEGPGVGHDGTRSEEHTSELQSRQYLVCRLLLEKKNTHQINVQFLDSHII